MLNTVLRPIEVVIRRVERELVGAGDDAAENDVMLTAALQHTAAALEHTAAAIDRHARALERLDTAQASVSELADAIERSTAAATALGEALAAATEVAPPPTREGLLGLRRQRTTPVLRPEPAPGQ